MDMDARGPDRMIDLADVTGAVDPRTLLAQRFEAQVDTLLPGLAEREGMAHVRFLDVLTGLSFAAEALHAAARREPETVADLSAVAIRHLDRVEVTGSIWD